MTVKEYTMGSGFDAAQFHEECVALDPALTMLKITPTDATPKGMMACPKPGTADKLVVTSIGGDFSAGEITDLDTVAAAHVAVAPPPTTSPLYGDGQNGDVTYTSTQTLTGNVYADNITVNAGVEVRLAGFFLFWRETLRLVDAASKVHDDGLDAAADVGGAALVNKGYRIATVAGSNGRSSLGAGASPAAYNGRRDNSQATFARGGAGGAAGGQAGGARATGSTWAAPGTATISVHSIPFVLGGGAIWRANDGGLQRWATGNGGAAGGCDPATGTATSGGGGGGGGAAHLAGRYITGLGSITANAGKGGDAVATGDGLAGGGGAGGPGRVCIICERIAPTVTVEAATALGGNGAGGGANGQATEAAGLVVVLEGR